MEPQFPNNNQLQKEILDITGAGNPLPPEMQRKKPKIFILVIIILAIGLMGFGAYVLFYPDKSANSDNQETLSFEVTEIDYEQAAPGISDLEETIDLIVAGDFKQVEDVYIDASSPLIEEEFDSDKLKYFVGQDVLWDECNLSRKSNYEAEQDIDEEGYLRDVIYVTATCSTVDGFVKEIEFDLRRIAYEDQALWKIYFLRLLGDSSES